MALKQLRQRGFLDQPVFYQLAGGIGIEVPIARLTNCWDQQDLDEYEQDLFQGLFPLLEQLQSPVTLIDAGADIGIFSLKIASRCPSVRRIIAFEPNHESYTWLKRNLDRLPYPALALDKAVSDFEGRGALKFPSYDPESEHACYLEPSPDGPIEVITVDSVNPPAAPHDLLLKLDLEGGEPAALRGAANTIRQARNALVVVEAHFAVAKRTGIDPVESLRFLASIRPFRFVVGETGESVAIDRPVLEQVSKERVYYDIIGQTV